MITIRLDNWGRLVSQLGQLPVDVLQRVALSIVVSAQAVKSLMQEKLSGGVLQTRTGRLKSSIRIRTRSSRTRFTARIGTRVKYAAIHEYGGTEPAHEIRAKKAKALAYFRGGELAFATAVQFPGAKMPERSFARSALNELAPEIIAAIEHAAQESAEVIVKS